MADFIDPSWIKISEYPPNFLPAGSIAINQASEDGDCTVKGFYDPATGEYHIQEVVHNAGIQGRCAALSRSVPWNDWLGSVVDKATQNKCIKLLTIV